MVQKDSSELTREMDLLGGGANLFVSLGREKVPIIGSELSGGGDCTMGGHCDIHRWSRIDKRW